MLLCDRDIRGLCVKRDYEGWYLGGDPEYTLRPSHFGYGYRGAPRPELEAPMIEPFAEPTSGNGVISFGLTSAGYDLRLGPEIFHFPERCVNTCALCRERGSCDKVADPKMFRQPGYVQRFFRQETVEEGNSVWINPHQYVLGRSLEYLRIPRFLKARCVGKSTLARSGILINTTPLEPEWEGFLTIEIGNITECPAKVYVGEGIAQLEFEALSGDPETSYKDKGGKYNKQVGVQPAIVN